jgi:hypothetical protein
MNDDQHFLANAYFDGELTDEESRIAEADPDVMSEVDRLGSLRSLLRDSDTPSASVRTAALAAAMAEFASVTSTSGTNATATPATRGHTTQIRRHRPAYGRYLAVAAAVAAIGAAGLVVAGVINSDSDDDSSGADLAISSTETLANVEADVTRAASATTVAAALEMEATSDQILAESAPAAATGGDTAEAEESATTAASDVAAEAVATEMNDAATTMVPPLAYSTLYPPTGGPIEPIADRDQTITTPGQLAGLGVLLADLRNAGTLGATPETSCFFDDAAIEIVDETRYRFPDATSTVLVALVAGDIEGHTLAIDPDTCDVVVVGP